jgi:hypothetical protein
MLRVSPHYYWEKIGLVPRRWRKIRGLAVRGVRWGWIRDGDEEAESVGAELLLEEGGEGGENEGGLVYIPGGATVVS